MKNLLISYDTYQMRMLIKNNKMIIAIFLAIKYQIIRSWSSTGRNIRKLLLAMKILKPTLWERMVASYMKPSTGHAPYIPKHTERNSTYAEDHWGGGNIHQ